MNLDEFLANVSAMLPARKPQQRILPWVEAWKVRFFISEMIPKLFSGLWVDIQVVGKKNALGETNHRLFHR